MMQKISRRAARWLIVLHPKKKTESELKRQNFYITLRIKMQFVS